MRRSNLKKFLPLIFVLLLILIAAGGCRRGTPSEDPPIHLNPNMDDQEKYKAQSENYFFANGSTMRPLVPGTVARGNLRADNRYYLGKDDRDNFIVDFPFEPSQSTLTRGKERFEIYCAPCHHKTGSGKGIIIEKGFVEPPSFYSDSVRTMENGYIYSVIANGVRNMPAYAHQIGVSDRWDIVAYIRFLQEKYDQAPEKVSLEQQR